MLVKTVCSPKPNMSAKDRCLHAMLFQIREILSFSSNFVTQLHQRVEAIVLID